MKRHVLTYFLSVVLTVVIMFSMLVMSVSASIVTLREDVVEAVLIELLETAKEDELIPIEIWTRKIDFSKVEEQIQEKMAAKKSVQLISGKSNESQQTLLAEVQERISLKR